VLHARLDYLFKHEFFMHCSQHLVHASSGVFRIVRSYPRRIMRAHYERASRSTDGCAVLRPAMNERPAPLSSMCYSTRWSQ
jgi:hypothetical protein